MLSSRRIGREGDNWPLVSLPRAEGYPRSKVAYPPAHKTCWMRKK
jgi:hypothetical protein